ncbi:MAG: phosphodiester glycosidase family protein [Rhodoluna sp.]|nr:phosphodiester glycosidase family protein [Rhodoluna sp.]
MRKIKPSVLPRTVGPWFSYWIEYVSAESLGVARKEWFKSSVQSILTGNSFARRELDSIQVADLTEFLETSVYKKFSRSESAMLRAYFHTALVAARNLGGAKNYSAKEYFTNSQIISRKLVFAGLAIFVVFAVFISSLTLDRVVRKQEDLLTASATVLRDNGFGVAVAFAEDVYYTYLNPAKVGGEPTADPNGDIMGALPKLNILTDAAVANNSAWGVARIPNKVPDRLSSPVVPLDGEGEWTPTKIQVNGNTAIWIAQIRPDEVHTSYWATVTWFDPKLLAFAQVPGTKIPEFTDLPDRTGQVPSNLKPFYVAGLNGGFLMRDSRGGYQLGDKVYQRLVKGKASLVTYNDGSFDVVKWGRDFVGGDIQSVRQNMELIVDGGVSQVESEDQSKWGWAWQGVGSGKNLVWRSAIGIRADGSMVYVIGDAMSAKSLGDVLVRAGARRAILLDMNSAYANGFLYGPYKGGRKIDPASTRSPERFWIPSERDFIAVYAKSPAAKAD